MNFVRYTFIGLLALIVFYFLGPRPQNTNLDPELPVIEYSSIKLEEWLNEREQQIQGIKEDNHARIIWSNDSLREKTEYVVIYLHGFSASQGEGEPIHREFARRYGFNLYLPRLQDHGIHSEEIFKDLTVESYMQSAKEAIAIGKQLGEKVILMSTSTGGTMSLYFAKHDPDIHSLIMYSPNIRINNSSAHLMSGPWGLQIARMVVGGKSFDFPQDSKWDSLYWTKKYRIEGLVALQALIDKTMNKETFESVRQPVFMAYYFKNQEEQDRVVVVEDMLTMYDQLATSSSMKRKMAFPEAGRHVIASKYKSNDWANVRDETFRFAEEILGFQIIVEE